MSTESDNNQSEKNSNQSSNLLNILWERVNTIGLSENDQIEAIRAEAKNISDMASNELDGTEEGKKLMEEGERLRKLINSYSESSDGKGLIKKCNVLLNDLYNSELYSSISDLLNVSSEFVNDIVSSEECKELISEGSDVINQLSELKDNPEAVEIMNIITAHTNGLVAGVVTADNLHWVVQQGVKVLDGKRLDEQTKLLIDNSMNIYDKIANNKKTMNMLEQGQKYLNQYIDIDWKGTGIEYIKDLKNDKTINKYLETGAVAIRDNKKYLEEATKEVLNTSKSLLTNAEARIEFLNKIKDASLNFLLQYLPQVKMPPIEGSDDWIAYTIDHIDLSGFKVPADSVEKEDITNSEFGLGINASDINCDLKDLYWEYIQTSFPYLSGSGKAECIAKDVKIKWEKIKDSEQFTPKLAVTDINIKLTRFEVWVEQSWLSSVYNFLTHLFHEDVRLIVEQRLNKSIKNNLSYLIDTLNSFIIEYLPLIYEYGNEIIFNDNITSELKNE